MTVLGVHTKVDADLTKPSGETVTCLGGNQFYVGICPKEPSPWLLSLELTMLSEDHVKQERMSPPSGGGAGEGRGSYSQAH